MSLMKQYARNKRNKENTIVLTARLPESIYNKFQSYCEEYGFSLSEAVNLLIQNEVKSIENDDKKNDDETKVNTGETKVSTNTGQTNTGQKKPNTDTGEKNTGQTNTKRFLVKPFTINEQLPCPICNSWSDQKNFSRHAKSHGFEGTKAFYTEYMDKVEEMVNQKKGEMKNG